MKRILMTIITILTIAVSVKAMSYEQARREALFLTDKMAYELNLNGGHNEERGQPRRPLRHILDTPKHRFRAHSSRMAVERILCSHIFLSSAILECRLLAFRNICPISATRLLLFCTPYSICVLSRRPQLAQQRRTKLLSQAQA